MTRDIGGGRGGIEPFSYVQAGLEAWAAEDHERAEQLLRRGVDTYRTREPDGVDFALGRLGAFLLDQERIDEAAEVLDEAISLKTDIPAIWSDYLDIMALRRDVDGLFDVAMRSHDNVGGTQPPWDGLLARARVAQGDRRYVSCTVIHPSQTLDSVARGPKSLGVGLCEADRFAI